MLTRQILQHIKTPLNSESVSLLYSGVWTHGNPETDSVIRKVYLYGIVIPAYFFVNLNPLFQKKQVSVVLELLQT